MPGTIMKSEAMKTGMIIRPVVMRNSPMYLRYFASKMPSGEMTPPLASSIGSMLMAIVVPTLM